MLISPVNSRSRWTGLTPKGYGQTKPLVPNVTAGNRQKNRRVQFIIADQDPAPTEAPKAQPKK
jgi:outer membrane protein OmpA-like peptidoglycan-associated protein